MKTLGLHAKQASTTASGYVRVNITQREKTKMPKESLRDKLDGNELDLSISNIDTPPVKELVRVPILSLNKLQGNQNE